LLKLEDKPIVNKNAKQFIMGVKLCSHASNGDLGNIYEFQCRSAENLRALEEQEDTDDDHDYFNLGRMSKTIHMIDKNKFIPPSMKKAQSAQVLRSRGYSLEQKRTDWHRSSVVNREAELRAKSYGEMLLDDTLKHLSDTIRTANSTVDKGAAINKELARQDPVISNTENDIFIAEYETDQVTQTLNEMSSLRGKLKSVIWKKKPKLKIKKSISDPNPRGNVNFVSLEEDFGLCAFTRVDCKPSSVDKHQIQFKAGMEQLHNALDIMTVQQMDAALALDSQKAPLCSMENRLTTTNNKLNCQKEMINKILGKS